MCVCGSQAYEDDDRRVRKAGVDVLVKLYERVGELLWTYITDISEAKVDNVSTLCAARSLSLSPVRCTSDCSCSCSV